MKRAFLVATLAIVLRSPLATAQAAVHLSAEATFAGIHSVADDGGVRRTNAGTALGGRGEVRFGEVALSVSYLEGTLRPRGGSSDIGFVEGSGAADLRVTPWLAMGTVVQVHRIDDVTPERWLFWGARAAVEMPIIGNALRGRASYAQGLGGTVNLPYGGVTARSGDVGLLFQLPERRFILSLTTGVEANEAGGRSRTLQHLMVTAGWSRR